MSAQRRRGRGARSGRSSRRGSLCVVAICRFGRATRPMIPHFGRNLLRSARPPRRILFLHGKKLSTLTTRERHMRARDLGIVVGRHPTGPNNAITDVAGVRVGHVTLDEDRPTRRPHRRHRRGPAPRHLDRTRLRRCSPAQRQRRTHRPRVDPRVGRTHHGDRADEHPQRRRGARCPRRGPGARRGRRASTGRCPSSARPTTACSATSTATTCAPSTSTTPWRRRATGRSPRAMSAAEPA